MSFTDVERRSFPEFDDVVEDRYYDNTGEGAIVAEHVQRLGRIVSAPAVTQIHARDCLRGGNKLFARQIAIELGRSLIIGVYRGEFAYCVGRIVLARAYQNTGELRRSAVRKTVGVIGDAGAGSGYLGRTKTGVLAENGWISIDGSSVLKKKLGGERNARKKIAFQHQGGRFFRFYGAALGFRGVRWLRAIGVKTAVSNGVADVGFALIGDASGGFIWD